MIRPITTSPPIRKPPNAATTWPAASGPSLPCDRISRVTATLSDRRSSVVSSSSVGKAGEIERPVEEQRHHQHQHGGGDGERQAEIEQQGRQRQDQHRQQHDHAKREADIAAGRVPARRGGQGGERPGECDGVSQAAMPTLRHAATPAAGGGTGDALRRVVAQLVAQRTDRDAEDGRRMRAVAQRMAKRLDDQVALHLLHPPADQRRDAADCRRLRGRTGRRPQFDRLDADLRPVGQQHRAMDGVLQFAHIAAPGMRRRAAAPHRATAGGTAGHSRRHSAARNNRPAPRCRRAARAAAECAATRR